ncbi:MAG: hypothetical protein JNJ54_28490 [Myxococcaceae bacterium]|nr:hypothetical protein [Myxococcaceae bacterium]
MQLDLLTTPRARRRREGVEQLHVLRVPLYDADEPGTQFKVVHEAVALAKEMARTSHLGHALSLVCTHFIAMMGGRSEAVRLLVPFEKLLGVRLIIVDRQSPTILYGMNTIQGLADAGDEPAGTRGDDALP